MKAFSHIKDSIVYIVRDVKQRNVTFYNLLMEAVAFGFGSYVVLYEHIPALAKGVAFFTLLFFGLLIWTRYMFQQNGVPIDGNKTLSFLSKLVFHLAVLCLTALVLTILYIWAPDPDQPNTTESETLELVSTIEASQKAQAVQLDTIGESLAQLVAAMNKESKITDKEVRLETSRITSSLEMKYAETLPAPEAKAAAERAVEAVKDIADVPNIETSLREKGGQAVVDALLEHKPDSDAKQIEYLRNALDWSYLVGDAGQVKTIALAILEHDKNDGNALARLGDIYFQQGDVVKAEEYYMRLKSVAPENSQWQATAYTNLGTLYSQRGDLDQSLLMHQKAVKINEELEYDIGIAVSNNDISVAQRGLGDYDGARASLEKALSINKRLGRDASTAANLNNLGTLYLAQGNLDMAEKTQKEALMLNQQVGYQQGISISHRELGKVFQQQGKTSAALNMFEKSLEIAQKTGSKAGMSDAYGLIGNIYGTQGKNEAALEMYQKALKISQELNTKIGLHIDYTNLATLYHKMGKLDKSLEMANKALQMARESGAKGSISQSSGNLGILYQAKGDLQGAMKMYEQALSMDQEMNDQLGMATQYGNIGTVYDDMKKYDKAMEFYQKAVVINEQAGNKEGMAYNHANIGLNRKWQRDYAGSKDHFEKALNLFQEVGMVNEVRKVHKELDWLDRKMKSR